MRLVGLLLIILSLSANATEEIYEIDISKCSPISCFNVLSVSFNIGKTIRVVAWADVVDTSKNGNPHFYPLFNIFNETSKQLNAELGMQLLDSNRKVILERTQRTQFSPYNQNASQYEVYRSLNAISLSKESLSDIKYVKVIVKTK